MFEPFTRAFVLPLILALDNPCNQLTQTSYSHISHCKYTYLLYMFLLLMASFCFQICLNTLYKDLWVYSNLIYNYSNVFRALISLSLHYFIVWSTLDHISISTHFIIHVINIWVLYLSVLSLNSLTHFQIPAKCNCGTLELLSRYILKYFKKCNTFMMLKAMKPITPTNKQQTIIKIDIIPILCLDT